MEAREVEVLDLPLPTPAETLRRLDGLAALLETSVAGLTRGVAGGRPEKEIGRAPPFDGGRPARH